MNTHFPLRGTCIGISISAGDDGVPPNEIPDDFINALTLRLCSNLFLSGATVALGHTWKKDGIMDHLAYWARQYTLPDWRREQATRHRPPQILNLIAWPDQPPSWSEDEQDQLRGILEIRQIPPPDALPSAEPTTTEFGKYIHARSLTAMRQVLPTQCDARLGLGGSLSPREGATWRLPGIIEETLYAYRAKQPLFISSALGGASKAMCNAILHRRIDDKARSGFFTPADMVARYSQFAAAGTLPPDDSASTETGWNALQEFSDIPLATLCQRSSLSEDEYLSLLTTHDIQRVMALTLAGISRIQAATVSTAKSPGN
jgi:SLOG cluster2